MICHRLSLQIVANNTANAQAYVCVCVFSFCFFCVCHFSRFLRCPRNVASNQFTVGGWYVRNVCLHCIHVWMCDLSLPHAWQYAHITPSNQPNTNACTMCYSRYLRSIHKFVWLREQKPKQRVSLPNPHARSVWFSYTTSLISFVRFVKSYYPFELLSIVLIHFVLSVFLYYLQFRACAESAVSTYMWQIHGSVVEMPSGRSELSLFTVAGDHRFCCCCWYKCKVPFGFTTYMCRSASHQPQQPHQCNQYSVAPQSSPSLHRGISSIRAGIGCHHH